METDRLWAFSAIVGQMCLAALVEFPRFESIGVSASARSMCEVALTMPPQSNPTPQVLFSWEEIFATNSAMLSTI